MLRSLKNIFITAALYLLMTVTSHAANTRNTMIKTYSTDLDPPSPNSFCILS